jgi:hypothetical protein
VLLRPEERRAYKRSLGRRNPWGSIGRPRGTTLQNNEGCQLIVALCSLKTRRKRFGFRDRLLGAHNHLDGGAAARVTGANVSARVASPRSIFVIWSCMHCSMASNAFRGLSAPNRKQATPNFKPGTRDRNRPVPRSGRKVLCFKSRTAHRPAGRSTCALRDAVNKLYAVARGRPLPRFSRQARNRVAVSLSEASDGGLLSVRDM